MEWIGPDSPIKRGQGIELPKVIGLVQMSFSSDATDKPGCLGGHYKCRDSMETERPIYSDRISAQRRIIVV
jgi:hypothetical protein